MEATQKVYVLRMIRQGSPATSQQSWKFQYQHFVRRSLQRFTGTNRVRTELSEILKLLRRKSDFAYGDYYKYKPFTKPTRPHQIHIQRDICCLAFLLDLRIPFWHANHFAGMAHRALYRMGRYRHFNFLGYCSFSVHLVDQISN